MPYIPNQRSQTGAYLPTTEQIDVTQILHADVTSPEFKELIVRLYQAFNNLSQQVNLKDTGYYVEEEIVNSQLYFNPSIYLNPSEQNFLKLRNVFRLTVDVGGFGAGATTAAHGLTPTTDWKFTRIYGVASETTTPVYYPLPYASAGGAANISLDVDGTNVNITNNSGVTFDDCYVVLEYVKE